MNKNIVIGRTGLTIKFKGIKIGTQTACDTDMMVYSMLSQMNPDFNFYFIGPTDLYKLTEEEYNDDNYKVSKAVFYLDDPENADKFKEEANKLVTDFSDRNLTLDIDNESYEQMISSIEGVAKFSNTVLVIVVIASIVVISLMVINSLKDRNYEIGVLLSLGEKRKKIIGQFIIELVIIATFAFITSIGSSLLVSQKLADTLLENQTTVTEKMNTSVILITHDLGIVADLCSRINVMYGGIIVEEGSAEDIFYNSKHPYTWGLLRSVPNPKSKVKEKLKPIDGQPPDLLKPPLGCPFAPRCDYTMKVCLNNQPPLLQVGTGHKSACWLCHEYAAKSKKLSGGEI